MVWTSQETIWRWLNWAGQISLIISGWTCWLGSILVWRPVHGDQLVVVTHWCPMIFWCQPSGYGFLWRCWFQFWYQLLSTWLEKISFHKATTVESSSRECDTFWWWWCWKLEGMPVGIFWSQWQGQCWPPVGRISRGHRKWLFACVLSSVSLVFHSQLISFFYFWRFGNFEFFLW